MTRIVVPLLRAAAATAIVLVAGGLHTHAFAADDGPRQRPACATASLDDLKRLCPAPSDAVSHECLAALGRRYAGRPVYCDMDSTPRDWHWSRAWRPLLRMGFRFQARHSSETPWFDWRGFEQAYSAEEIKAALPAAERIRTEGWPPCCKPQRSDSPWPWAEQPTVVARKFVRRRIDEEGNVRWIYRSGTETWFKDGVRCEKSPGSEELTGTYHSRIAQATLRRWIDDDGTERWIDETGDEHWLDADGTEHWIELDGTEWILLPVGKPFPPESAAESQ